MPTSFLYFDLGNVLLSFCTERMCRQIASVVDIPAESVRQVFFEAEGASQRQVEYESGRLSTDEYFLAFCGEIDSQPDAVRVREAAADIFTPIEPMIELVRRLHRQGCRLGLLSNTNDVHWRWFTDGRYPLLASPGRGDSPFEVALASHFVGAMKPDPRIYAAAVERAGVPAAEIFFVDDRWENVEGARQAGIDAVLYSDAQSVEQELRERGITVGA